MCSEARVPLKLGVCRCRAVHGARVCRFARDAPYLGDTVLAAALAQIYTVRMRYFDKLSSGYKRGFQCFAQGQVCRPPLTCVAPRLGLLFAKPPSAPLATESACLFTREHACVHR